MHIYIKSFNRAYYLDKCISSIEKYCKGDYQIIILDDGTNQVYLDKLKSKFPSVVIKESPFRKNKIDLISINLKSSANVISELEIPAKFWLDSILEDNHEIFMLIEDDMWFIEMIDLDEIKELFIKNSLQLLKLASYGNEKINCGKHIPLNSEINAIIPKLLIINPRLFKYFINNKFKSRSIINKVSGINNNKYLLNYYSIYVVAGAFYKTSYYKYLWEDFSGKVNESKQLIRAVNFYKYHHNDTYYATYKDDKIKTSFSSSATNMFAEINFNVFRYNYILNEAWLNNILDPMESHPRDFSNEIIKRLLDSSNYKDAGFLEWQKWKSIFEGRYKELGFKI